MKRLKRNFGFTMIELIIVLSLLGIVGIGAGSYLSNVFRDGNKLANKTDVQTSVTSLMNKLETSIKTAAIPVFEIEEGKEFNNKEFTINQIINRTICSMQFKHNDDKNKVVTYKNGSKEKTYEYIETISIEPIIEKDNIIGASITINGEDNQYSLSATYYTRNMANAANTNNNGNGNDDGNNDNDNNSNDIDNGNNDNDNYYNEERKIILEYDVTANNKVSNVPSSDIYYLLENETQALFIITDIVPIQSGLNTFAGWKDIETDKVYFAGDELLVEFEKDGENIKELTAVWRTPKVGEYIIYEPNQTSYTVKTAESGNTSNQTYNPSNTTTWQVFSNDGEKIEIISASSVGALALAGEEGYRNGVKILNDISNSYVNPEYATSARSLGYDDSRLSKDEIEDYEEINAREYAISYKAGSELSFPYKDDNWFEKDIDVIEDNEELIENVSADVWLGSRYAYTNGDYLYFIIMCWAKADDPGTRGYYQTCTVDSSGTLYPFNCTKGVRPVVTLRTDLSLSGGDGTSSNPYTITTNEDAYTIVYNRNGGLGKIEHQMVNKGSTVTLATNEFTKYGYEFVGWATSRNGSVKYTNEQAITPSSNITLYAVWEKIAPTLVSVAKVGDYVTYVSNKTSYTVSGEDSGVTGLGGTYIDQTYNPSSVISWKVFSNNGTNVEIISTESVGDLELQGKTGYIKAVQTLNDLSSAYVNPDYAISGRSLGYSEDGLTKEDIANYKTIDTSTYPINNLIDDEAFPYTDTQDTADETIIKNNTSLLAHTSGGVWVASREASIFNTSGYLKMKDWYSSSGYTSTSFSGGSSPYYYESGYWYTKNVTNGVRPIVNLKSKVKVLGGDGTEANPWIVTPISALKYDGNGGNGASELESYILAENETIHDFTVTNIVPTRFRYNFLGWATSSDATTAEYTAGDSIEVGIEIKTLYAVWESKPLLSSVVKPGDYVQYEPSKYSYDYSPSITFYPSSTTIWRVLKNVDGVVDIITPSSVGSITFEGSSDYSNYNSKLTNISQAYINNTYAESSRAISYTKSDNTDNDDVKQIQTYSLGGGTAWVNSKYTDSDGADASINAGIATYEKYKVFCLEGTAIKEKQLYVKTYNRDGSYRGSSSSEQTAGVRPVITLRSELVIVSGSGTQADPYIIE